jgi:hypothetical protein
MQGVVLAGVALAATATTGLGARAAKLTSEAILDV